MLIFVCKLNDGAATKFVCLMEIIQHQDVAMGQDKICGRGGGDGGVGAHCWKENLVVDTRDIKFQSQKETPDGVGYGIEMSKLSINNTTYLWV